MRSFIICALDQNIIKMVKSRRMGGACSTHGSYKMITKFWFEGLKVGDHSEDLLLKWIKGNYISRIWTGFFRLRTGAAGGIL
jgi:hypothetical protein